MSDRPIKIRVEETARFDVEPHEIIDSWTVKEQAAFWAGDQAAIKEFEAQACDQFSRRRGSIDLESNAREVIAASPAHENGTLQTRVLVAGCALILISMAIAITGHAIPSFKVVTAALFIGGVMCITSSPWTTRW